MGCFRQRLRISSDKVYLPGHPVFITLHNSGYTGTHECTYRIPGYRWFRCTKQLRCSFCVMRRGRKEIFQFGTFVNTCHVAFQNRCKGILPTVSCQQIKPVFCHSLIQMVFSPEIFREYYYSRIFFSYTGEQPFNKCSIWWMQIIQSQHHIVSAGCINPVEYIFKHVTVQRFPNRWIGMIIIQQNQVFPAYPVIMMITTGTLHAVRAAAVCSQPLGMFAAHTIFIADMVQYNIET